MVRCSQDRSKTRYDPECVNARQAVDRIQAKEEAAARAALEARSESKIEARRRTQAAAAEAARRADEERRRREEAEYLAQFGVSPDDDASASEPMEEGNLPIANVPTAEATEAVSEGISEDSHDDAPVPTDTAQAPVPQVESEQEPTDLESVRDELRRRDEEGSE